MAEQQGGDSPYKLVISLTVLDDLGDKLYSSIPAVLSEAVANAWDADAREVSIQIDFATKTIVITDDGVGMDLNDVNDKYLTVGYRRRESGQVTTALGRHVMGRKGIGKLSLFSIANDIEIQTVKLDENGTAVVNGRHRFLMCLEDVRKSAKDRGEYRPVPLSLEGIEIKKGTRLKLSNLRRTPIATTIPALRRRLARRFSIIGSRHGFSVVVQGSPIDVADRDYFNQLQYLWLIGDVGDEFEGQISKVEKSGTIPGQIVVDDMTYSVTGWIGTFDEQRSIVEGDNTVVVHAWGKLLHEDLLSEVKAGGLYTKYIIGEIRANFIDLDDKPDIVTTDRQHLIEDDPRFQSLVSWLKATVLSTVEGIWGDWRAEDSLSRALTIDAVKDWHATLSPDNKRFAKQLFAKIGKLHLADEDTKGELYRNAILAFEKLRLREELMKIEELPEDADLMVVGKIFSGIDEIEAVEYHSIAKSRLAVIDAFSKIVDEDQKEKIIQQYIFDHLWLLHPSWERASTNARIEEAVIKEFENVELTDEEKRGRIDIRYKTAAGKHIIIELKRASVSVNVYDLSKQLAKYREALLKCLEDKFPQEPIAVEVISILGKPPTGLDAEAMSKTMDPINARYITYETLIKEALDSYREYLEADQRVTKLMGILDRL